MRTVILSESYFDDIDQVHDYLADQLDFPPYYGRNLDALNDCLGDICEPTTIVIDADHEQFWGDDSGKHDFFDRVCRVVKHAAEENDDLTVIDAHDYLEHLYSSDSPEDFE